MNQKVYSVLKFGGGITINASNILYVIKYLLDRLKGHPERPIVAVFSAFGKTTNDLSAIFELKKQNRIEAYNNGLNMMLETFTKYINDVFAHETSSFRQSIIDEFSEGPFKEFVDALRKIDAGTNMNAQELDSILVFGEYFSVWIVNQAIRKCIYTLDFSAKPSVGAVYGHQAIITNEVFGNADILEVQDIRSLCLNDLTLITGYTGCTQEGVSTTLGREGSDYTAIFVAIQLGAIIVDIFKNERYILGQNGEPLFDIFHQDVLDLLPEATNPFLHPKGVMYAAEHNFPIRFRHFDVGKYAEGEPIGTLVRPKQYHQKTE